jgi:hypothetical protein
MTNDILKEMGAQAEILTKAKEAKGQGVSNMRREWSNHHKKRSGAALKSIRGVVKTKFGDVDRIYWTGLRYMFIRSAGFESYEIRPGQIMAGSAPTNWIPAAIDPIAEDFADFVSATQADAMVKYFKFSDLRFKA